MNWKSWACMHSILNSKTKGMLWEELECKSSIPLLLWEEKKVLSKRWERFLNNHLQRAKLGSWLGSQKILLPTISKLKIPKNKTSCSRYGGLNVHCYVYDCECFLVEGQIYVTGKLLFISCAQSVLHQGMKDTIRFSF